MSAQDILAGYAKIQDWQEDLYKQLHRNPELSMQEEQTADLMAQRLESFGYQVHRIGGGVVGVLENGDGPTVLFRADMDALPVKEDTGLDYASTQIVTGDDGQSIPVMHACGHDMHMAAGLGAAALLADHQDAWSGTYLALFQPGEEIAAGARAMVDDGLVDKLPKPDVALAQHVLSTPWSGEVALAEGPALSTAASVQITVHGKGSHGSMPHLGVDPVVIASAIVMRLQTLVSRELAPDEFGVVTVGSLQAGSSANIIPASAALKINVRAYSEQTRKQLLEGIERIVRAECEASRCPKEPEIEVHNLFPLTQNDPGVTKRVRDAFTRDLGADRVKTLAPQTASEDFSVVPDAFSIPYTFWGFGAYPEGEETVANHNPGFAPVVQPTLRTGTEAAVSAVLAFLGKE